MKKLTFLLAFTLFTTLLFANGIITNTNQSTQFVRMMSRNASLGIDAVYYNPAGLIKLDDGWHFSLNNQSIFQTSTITSNYPLLNHNGNPNGMVYEGKTDMPFFPSGFAVYKKSKWAFSFGFGPNAGGGTTHYDQGLPSFEIPISQVVPELAPIGEIDPSMAVSGYDANLTLDASSVFWGFQLGASYSISEMFSAYFGVRYMSAKNTYLGSIKSVQLQVAGQMESAPDWLNDKAGIAQTGADMPQYLQPIINDGGGDYTLQELENGEIINSTQRASIEGGLQLMGLSQAQIDAMNLNMVNVAYVSAGPTFQENANKLSETATQLEDKAIDVEQTGAFITPIIGFNISANENLNIGLKYEHKTYLTVQSKVAEDDFGLFEDGKITRSDVPGIISAGVGYTDNYWFEAQLSYNMYLDKYVFGEAVTQNSFDIALGLQVNVSDNFSVSAGGMYQKTGIVESYNTDINFINPSSTGLGAGVMWKINEQLTLDLGVSKTFYTDSEVDILDPYLNQNYKETYGKDSFSFAVGLSYSIPY